MFNPVSTYRLQFNKGFTFDDLERITPYLEQLGTNTIYASPVFKSVQGSMHGYDGVNPLQINPEIGTIEQLRRISKKLKDKGINWLQDIVPNHTAFHEENEWLMDVLEKGPLSPYKDFFDNSLSGGGLFEGPIMLPFLAEDLNTEIENGKLEIAYKSGYLVFKTAENNWPLALTSYGTLFDRHKAAQPEQVTSLIEQIGQINDIQQPGHYSEAFDAFKNKLAGLYWDGALKTYIDSCIEVVNHNKQLLAAVAGQQHYRLCNYTETDKQINYRRFFTVNNPICLNTHRPGIFSQFHQLILSLVKEGVFQGLCIGHGDSLYNPDTYLKQLRKAAGADVYIVVEKILGQDETMPANWPVQGNSGYDFLPMVNNLLTNQQSAALFTGFYEGLVHNTDTVNKQVTQKEAWMLKPQMGGEWDNLGRLFTTPGLAGDGRPNKVGDPPGAFGIGVNKFHTEMKYRRQQWPLSGNATATHGTKRGEDFRARLNVLTDMAGQWLDEVKKWQIMNMGLKQNNAPGANDEYFIYETLTGAYPMPGEDESSFEPMLLDYLQKNMREARLNYSYTEPDRAYEEGVKHFAQSLLNKQSPFWETFTLWQQKVVDFGIINSLSQLLLKLTCPGVPDVYQGCELWDFSFVDPDNRRPVDYGIRANLLEAQAHQADNEALFETLWQSRYQGGIKMQLTRQVLKERRENPLLFAEGAYVPLAVKGAYREYIVSFARHYRQTWYVVAVPLNLAGLCKLQGKEPQQIDWKDTAIILPGPAPEKFIELLHHTEGKQKQQIAVNELFKSVPLALLKLEQPANARSAGILMPLSSLPSAFGIGDFGPEARKFVDMLHRSYQKYWQLLPINPVGAQNFYSPYSSFSSMAGNTLFISPQLLVADGLLTDDILKEHHLADGQKIDYPEAERIKLSLLDAAWNSYQAKKPEWLQTEFNEFRDKEGFWVNNYALYNVLKRYHQNRPWYQWPDAFKSGDSQVLLDFSRQNSEAIEKEQWLQFIFNRQWQQLKSYCHKQGVRLIGDLPFYISYDSVDVWSHRDIFSLDEEGGVKFQAGVPPDYFNSNGQLWGMPVFNWDKLKEQNYAWWLQRVKKNVELFDLLRLDHFRAFSSYWAVPAADKTAINGSWQPGPGSGFFNILKREIGPLPFIAEDLGEIDDAVYQLRDEFELPGMAVVQFAFGGQVAYSPHIPHNYKTNQVAYTGTHDNNTAKGWYRQDTSEGTRKQLSLYTGVKATEDNVNRLLIKMIMASVANLVIIPVQDLIGLDENARINTPAVGEGNWAWRLTDGDIVPAMEKRLKKWTLLYNRMA